MAEMLALTHERVDDIPVLMGLQQRLPLPDLLDQCLGTHHLHEGLSNGTLATTWMSYIVSEGDNRKSSVEDWTECHRVTLEHLLGQPIRPVEFNDDRLGIVLHRLGTTPRWGELEEALWAKTVAVYDFELTGVRLDSTTSYGYHTPGEDGLMQLGYSKDHRPDLAQLKLMAGAIEPSGHLVACDVLPAQSADDPLYLPLIARIRQTLGWSGLLYTGDCKMATLATRADIVAHGDYYLTPLPLSGDTRAEFDAWVGAAVEEGDLDSVDLVWDGKRLLGPGYEFQRGLQAEVDGQTLKWTERVLVVRSRDLARQQATQLEERLGHAAMALRAPTPVPGRGKRQFREESALQRAIAEVMNEHRVTGLLKVGYEREENAVTRYVGRGRGGPQRPQRTQIKVRYVVTGVLRAEEAITKQRNRLGWRVLVTNMPVERLTLTQAVIHYRGGWCLERDFHLIKDRPLGIRPLYVRKDNAFSRAEITLTRVELGGRTLWHITPLSDPLERILGHLGLHKSLYEALAYNSS